MNPTTTIITTTTTIIVTRRKKKNSSSDPSLLSYAEEIANASSPATVELLSSYLYRLTDGIPVRELKMVVSEAKTCEAALEAELKILRRALEQEMNKKKKSKVESHGNGTVVNGGAAGGGGGNSGSKDTSTTTTTTNAITPDTIGASSSPTPKERAALKTMLESEFTPPDAHWTLSALLGRLRHEFTTPLPPSSLLPAHREKQGLTQLAHNVGMASQSAGTKKSWRVANYGSSNSSSSSNNKHVNAQASTTANANTANENVAAGTGAGTSNATTPNDAVAAPNGGNGGRSTSTSAFKNKTAEDASGDTTTTASLLSSSNELSSQFRRLGSLLDYPEYSREHSATEKLLAVWKKLYMHRSSLVFRRPVNPKEAPGYTDRIRFPMDLSLIRKLILSRHVRNYEGILKQVHLIGHNCVKYNGRESDYALVTREFESVATEYVWTAVTREARGNKGSTSTSRTISPMTGTAANSPFVAVTAAANTYDSKITRTNNKISTTDTTASTTKMAITGGTGITKDTGAIKS